MEVLTTAIREEKQNKKGIQIEKEEVKLSLLADDIIMYTEDPRISTQKLAEVMNESSRLQNTASSTLLRTKNEISESES